MGVDGLFPRDAGEPTAVHVLPPGQPLLFHRDQRQPARAHCRRQLLCQRQAGRAHRVVAARRVRWRAGGFHLAAVEDAEYEPVMLFINHSGEPNVGFAGNTVLVAMRDISPGEELTTDYALFDDYDGMMQYRCRTPSCRTTQRLVRGTGRADPGTADDRASECLPRPVEERKAGIAERARKIAGDQDRLGAK